MRRRIRGEKPVVALETTLLVHGVPRGNARGLGEDLAQAVRSQGAEPAVVGVFAGTPTVGLTAEELDAVLAAAAVPGGVPKANTPNLGVCVARKRHAATTVSATVELAAAAGVRWFATGGLGGVHRGYGEDLDVSADLAALARFPVAAVGAGVKSLLDVPATREALEALGVPVFGWETDVFPAFYLRDGGRGVDARFDDAKELAACCAAELARTGRGVFVVQPPPEDAAIEPADWDRWLTEAHARTAGAVGRAATPAILSALHEVSAGATLRTNIALAKANARLAAQLAVAAGRH